MIRYLLKEQHLRHYISEFKNWLRLLGYSGTTVKNYPKMLQEFFYYIEQAGITEIEEINQQTIDSYAGYLHSRPNYRQVRASPTEALAKVGGGLSNGHINRCYGVLEKFKQYIEKTEGKKLPYQVTYIKKERNAEVDFLQEEEIKALYNATDETPHGYRDRAMLSIFYGCGLRRNEGVQLDTDHIFTERKTVLVTQPKNNYERQVPITGKHFLYITQYLETARPFFLPRKSKEHAFFISERGKRIDPNMIYKRIERLGEIAGITKTIGVHTLRHSIATHLLKKGMDLENIALFLGHRSLDSTQVYTHILNEKY
ncbi:MAG: tyrosine-type recombinase/integrase [Bacteroidota bacterium]